MGCTAFAGGGFFNRSSGGSKGAVPPPLPYSLPPLPALDSELSLHLLEPLGPSSSLHQHQQPLNHPIYTLHPGVSFLPPRVVANRARCFARRRYLEVLDPCLDPIRGARVWDWVNVCRGHRLARLGSSRSCGRGGQKMKDGNHKEVRLARARLHVGIKDEIHTSSIRLRRCRRSRV